MNMLPKSQTVFMNEVPKIDGILQEYECLDPE